MEKTTQDIVYCDAGFFTKPDEKNGNAILGIIYGKEVTRIKAKAKNATIAELLAILMAKKLYPNKLVVNDCKAVTDMITQNRAGSLKHLLRMHKADVKMAQFLIDTVNTAGIMWQRRRTDEVTCMVDSATRRQLSQNYLYRLTRKGYTLRECGF